MAKYNALVASTYGQETRNDTILTASPLVLKFYAKKSDKSRSCWLVCYSEHYNYMLKVTKYITFR